MFKFFYIAPYWVPKIARTLGIPTAFFCIVLAAAVTFLGPTSPAVPADDRKSPEDYTVQQKWVPFKITVAWRLFETLRSCDLIAVRSCAEFEPEWLNVLQVIHGKTVLPVGVLSTTPEDNNDNETWLSIKDWLDHQSKITVVYVALGTEAIPSQEEATEIALGLEKSGLPFFWALRTKPGEDAVKLPEGFEERNEGRGMVCRSWVPQLKILAK
ncbi:hypothetical protein ACLB2K_007940 [Fragaria x ananassa]